MAQELTTQNGRDVTERHHGNGQNPVTFTPMVDIFEQDGTTIIVADMPGVAPDEIDVTLERQVLTLMGRVNRSARDGYRRLSAEYREGDYLRVFTLSEQVDQDNIKADFINGVLRLELPRAVEAQPKKISVKAA